MFARSPTHIVETAAWLTRFDNREADLLIGSLDCALLNETPMTCLPGLFSQSEALN